MRNSARPESPTRTIVVTDDLASAPRAEQMLRRGVAGDLFVIKVAAAAAEAGFDLDAVAVLAARANKRTSSLSVAFTGCTLPGSDAPLFSLPQGRMGVGLGLHGEPGISEEPLLRAAELADLLVARVLAERPDGARRAAVLVNGMGSTRYEELFVLWNEIAPRLEDHGVDIVEPEVGELITSLDMAGVSLTLSWLDEELEAMWGAPATSPAYRKTPVESGAAIKRPIQPPAPRAVPTGSPDSQEMAKRIHIALESVADRTRRTRGRVG